MMSNESLRQLEDEIRETRSTVTKAVTGHFMFQLVVLFLSFKAMSRAVPCNNVLLLSTAILWVKGVYAISTIYTGLNRCRELLNKLDRAKRDKKDGAAAAAAADGGATLARNKKKQSIVLWFNMVFVLAFAIVVFVMLITMATATGI